MKWYLKEFTFDDIRREIVMDNLFFWGQYLEIMENPLFIFNPVLSDYARLNPYC